MGSQTRYGEDCVSFTINEQLHKVSGQPADLRLSTYIREYAGLNGTKVMCREGNCGSCVVMIQLVNPATGKPKTISINSCIFPVYLCHGLKVTTVEGIGSKCKGYNEVQTRLANFYGTQCGYCSPGWVMSMFSLLKSKPGAKMKEIEDSLSGNLCRCTGYRPILDAFKCFAPDRSKDLDQKVVDIEDLVKNCHRGKTTCGGTCDDPVKPCDSSREDEWETDAEYLEVALAAPSLKLDLRGGATWYKVDCVNEIFELFTLIRGTYMLVTGYTSQGIFKDECLPDVYIDINSISFLKEHWYQSNGLYLGVNVTLSDTVDIFKRAADDRSSQFSYLLVLAKHILKTGNTSIRNVATLGGSLSLKHQHRNFQSDIFVILETVGAVLSIRSENGSVKTFSLLEYLDMSMYKKVILQIILPPLENSCYIVKSFKIMPRAQNALSYISAGFRFRVNQKDGFRVLERPSLVFGNINSSFVHAEYTEAFLTGKNLLDVSALQKALQTLGKEVEPDLDPRHHSPQYRRGLTQALLYKVILSLSPDEVLPRLRSGGEDLKRPLSSGKQEYECDMSKPPLYQPFPKLESLIQCSGEAEYIYDISSTVEELYAALVIAKQGPAKISSINTTGALNIPGVVAFFSAKDIPGENTFTTVSPVQPCREQLFAEKVVQFAGQPVGMVVARTQELADLAARMVDVSLSEQTKPVLDVEEVVRRKDSTRIVFRQGKTAIPKVDVRKVVKGDYKLPGQYHFTLETLTCVVAPFDDDSLDVYSATQWPQLSQEAIALLLDIPEKNINVVVCRVGGSYGLKVSRASIASCACSLAAWLLRRPVRILLTVETQMESIGKRYPCYFTYEAGVNNEGEIQYLNSQFFEDAGVTFNDGVIPYAFEALSNVYDTSTWGTKMYDVKTDKPCNIWSRAGGSLEAITMAEHVMEHIAHELGCDPLAVRMSNLNSTFKTPDLIATLIKKSDFETRKTAVDEYNHKNLWRKRGISLVPIRFPGELPGNYYATLSVYQKDATVRISHGGVEIGQGLNTKVAQICAALFHIPIEYVFVTCTNNLVSPNNAPTISGLSDESIYYAVEQCCLELLRRLAPLRSNLDDPDWLTLIRAAYNDYVNLNVSYMYATEIDFKRYNIFGATVLEVEVDILTAEYRIVRADILEDVGKSLNQFIDIGQIEGAFVMGLGYFTSEELKYDCETGHLLTNRPLYYNVPGAKDIPTDFRVYIMTHGDNPDGVLKTKAVSQPPLCLAPAVMFAIRQAVISTRSDLGLPNIFLKLEPPCTPERIFTNLDINVNQYLL